MTTRGGAKYSLGLDIGGTKIAAGLLDAEGNLTEVTNAPTRGLGAAAVDQIVEIVQRYADRFDLSAVGLAVPGGVDPRTGAISSAPNLDWHHLDIVAELAGRLSRPLAFRVENDASAAGWAEYRFGRHRAGDSLVLVTVGTGLGGAVVVDGHLVRGWTGAGGEVGHVALKPLGRRCECGSRGCWEQYASGTALTRAARRAGWGAATASRDVLTAAASGDERASGVVLAHAGHLVHGLAILTAVLDPAQVLLGGGLGTDERYLAFVRRAAESFPIPLLVLVCRFSPPRLVPPPALSGLPTWQLADEGCARSYRWVTCAPSVLFDRGGDRVRLFVRFFRRCAADPEMGARICRERGSPGGRRVGRAGGVPLARGEGSGAERFVLVRFHGQCHG